MWIIANVFQKEGGISPRINQDSVKGAAVRKKKNQMCAGGELEATATSSQREKYRKNGVCR